MELRDNALDAASHSEGHEQSPKDSTMSHRPTQHASFRTIDRLRCIAGLALGIGLLAARTGRAEPTQPPPAPQATAAAASSHHLDLAATGESPNRKRAEAHGAGAAKPAAALPEPGAALRALRSAVSSVAPAGPLAALVRALDLVDKGQASLSVREFCTSSGELSRWLGEQKPSAARNAVEGARHNVCAQANRYQRKVSSRTLALDAGTDEFGGILHVASTQTNGDPRGSSTTAGDGHDCVIMAATVPNLPGQTDVYELASYVLPGGKAAIIEQGMKIGPKVLCKSSTKPTPADPCTAFGHACPTQIDYGAHITLSYNGIGAQFLTMELDPLKTREVYHELPDDAFTAGRDGKTIALSYQVIMRECKPVIAAGPRRLLSYACTTKNLGAVQTMELTTVPVGSMCRLSYESNEFTVNDRSDVNPENEWVATRITALDGTAVQKDPPYNSRFYAWARTLIPVSHAPWFVSSMPDLNLVSDGEWFAIHSDDNLEGGSPHSLWTQSVFSFNQSGGKGPGAELTPADFIAGEGTTVLSGLMFPRVVTPNPRNAFKPYSFTCQPPRIVRDFVAFCSWDSDLEHTDSSPDSLYLLPFKGRSSVLQGNQGSYSHLSNTREEYAYDFTTKYMSDDNVYAARSGFVTSAFHMFDGAGKPHYWNGTTWGFWPAAPCKKDSSGGTMSANPDCNANQVFIVHQDGTEARYYHFMHHGVVVAEHQIVHRGQRLGQSGNTGNSFTQHIHFDVQEAKPDGSGPVAYVSGAVTSSMPVTFDEGDHPCHRPKVLQLVDSTLTRGNSTAYNFLTNSDYSGKMPLARSSTKVAPLPRNCPAPTNNTCGGCAMLAGSPGSSCGKGLSAFVCDGPDAVKCNGGGPNVCGGWATLQHKPGASCGPKLRDKCWTCASIDLMTCQTCAGPD